MRSRSLIKFLAVPVAAAGIVGAAAVAAPAAHADTVYQLDQGGTVTLTLPTSYVNHLAKAGILGSVPRRELTIDGPDKTVTLTLTVTGGEADVNAFAGSVDLSGSVTIDNNGGCQEVKLKGLQLDVTDAALVATPAGSKAPVTLLDLSGVTVSSTPDATNPNTNFADAYDASSATIDPAGAAYLNKALGTKAFKSGKDVGSVAASWEVVYPA